MVDVCVPVDAIEAEAIEQLLEENDIEVVVISFHDDDFDGDYDTDEGWGLIRVNEEDVDLAAEIIEDWRYGEAALM